MVVLQSNYLPWIGYFHLVASADVFVVLDSVQFTKNDWRNRNILIGPNGPFWLTIPVSYSHSKQTPIAAVETVNNKWQIKHPKSIDAALSGTDYWPMYRSGVLDCYLALDGERMLSKINKGILSHLMEVMNIQTEMVIDKDLGRLPSDATQRLVRICQIVGASQYLTGPSGLNYLRVNEFSKVGIPVEVFEYPRYGPYPQVGHTFNPAVSVLDFLANNDPNAVAECLEQATVRIIDPKSEPVPQLH